MTGHITSIPGATTFPFGPPPKRVSFRAMGHFWGSPLFLAVLGLCHDRGISTLNFGPFSTKLGGTVRAIKKMTQNDNGPFPGANYGETAEKCFFGQKCILSPKHSKFLKRLIYILEKGTFFFERLFLGMARPWLGQKSEFFRGDPKSRFLAKIYDLCHTTPILVNGPTARL